MCESYLSLVFTCNIIRVKPVFHQRHFSCEDFSSPSDVTAVKELATVDIQPTQQLCSHATHIQRTDLTTSPAKITDQIQSNELSEDVLTECNDLAKVHICQQQNEFENASLSQVNVKGNYNLKKHLNFWKEIGAPQFILDVIESGYKLPFTMTPGSVSIRNNRSAKLHAQFVEEATTELCQSGRVIECPWRRRWWLTLYPCRSNLTVKNDLYWIWDTLISFCTSKV